MYKVLYIITCSSLQFLSNLYMCIFLAMFCLSCFTLVRLNKKATLILCQFILERTCFFFQNNFSLNLINNDNWVPTRECVISFKIKFSKIYLWSMLKYIKIKCLLISRSHTRLWKKCLNTSGFYNFNSLYR